MKSKYLISVFLLLTAACDSGDSATTAVGELGRGVFHSACQVSPGHFIWDFDSSENVETVCPIYMLDMRLAVGSTAGVYYESDAYSCMPFMAVAPDRIAIEDDGITVMEAGVTALVATTEDYSRACDLLHVHADLVDRIDIKDAAFAFIEGPGNADEENASTLVIPGSGSPLEIIAVTLASDGEPLGGRRIVEWEVEGPVMIQWEGQVKKLSNADITVPVTLVSTEIGDGWITVRDTLTGIEGRKRVLVR